MQESQNISSTSQPVVRKGKDISNGRDKNNCFDNCKFERRKSPVAPPPTRTRSTGGKDLKASQRVFQSQLRVKNQKNDHDLHRKDSRNLNNGRKGLRRSSRINSAGSSVELNGNPSSDWHEKESVSDEDETSSSSQGCLKLTIRVRRLEDKLRLVPNPVLEDKNKNSSRSKDSAITYEVLPSSASDCSSFSPVKGLKSSPNRSTKRRKVKKRRRQESGTSEGLSHEDDAPLTRSRGAAAGISNNRGLTSSGESPFIGAKRLRLIVGNDSISIDIPPNSSQNRRC